jgi:hypothetical protein
MPDGRILKFTVIGEITHPQAGSDGSKVLYLQQLEFEDGHTELRFCYYILGKKPKMLGKWVFGQFAPITPPADFYVLVAEAEKRGWFNTQD